MLSAESPGMDAIPQVLSYSDENHSLAGLCGTRIPDPAVTLSKLRIILIVADSMLRL